MKITKSKRNTRKRTLNRELITELMDHYHKYPATLDMHTWAHVAKKNQAHPCGTVGCIAATAVQLRRPEVLEKFLNDLIDYRELRAVAMKLLGLTARESESVFYTQSWPEQFRYSYQEVSRLIWSRIPERILQERMAEITNDRLRLLRDHGK